MRNLKFIKIKFWKNIMYYEKHIFVCENLRTEENARISCGKFNSKKIKDLLKQKLKESGSTKKIRINQSGCLDRCELGPVQVSYPEGIWFSLKSESDIDLFLSEYILNDDLEKIKTLLIDN